MAIFNEDDDDYGFDFDTDVVVHRQNNGSDLYNLDEILNRMEQRELEEKEEKFKENKIAVHRMIKELPKSEMQLLLKKYGSHLIINRENAEEVLSDVISLRNDYRLSAKYSVVYRAKPTNG